MIAVIFVMIACLVEKVFSQGVKKAFAILTQRLFVFLLHRNALGEVSWAVNILALADGNMVGQQLQGDTGN